MLLTSRISRQGRTTIPKKVRDSLGVEPGDLVAYQVRGNVVKLNRVDAAAAYQAALSQTLDEWASAQDEEAFRNL